MEVLNRVLCHILRWKREFSFAARMNDNLVYFCFGLLFIFKCILFYSILLSFYSFFGLQQDSRKRFLAVLHDDL